MSDQANQIAEIKARNKAMRQVMVREMDGGYIVAGSTQYINRDTNGAEWTENAERLATTPEAAAQAGLNYLRSSNFDGGAVAPAPVDNTVAGTPVV